MTFPLELNGNPDKHNEMLVRTSPKKIPTADMLTAGARKNETLKAVFKKLSV